VRSEFPSEEDSLKDEVEQSEGVLCGFEKDLHDVDAELEALIQKNDQYELLSQICGSLDQLDSMGATKLFWDEQSGSHHSAEYISSARRRIEEYGEDIVRIRDRREAIIDRIGNQNFALDALHYDLRDAMEREESRNNEWRVEKDQVGVARRVQVMPWARGGEEDDRFRRSLGASILACLLLGFMVSIIDLPILEREAIIEVPERIAKLVREERAPPPEPEPIQEPLAPEEELPEPEPQLAEEQPPEEQPKATEEPLVAETPAPDTREQVKSKGILAFRESFANRASVRPSAQLGSQASLSTAGDTAVGRPQRSMVTTSAPGSSGGINLADISRAVGGGGQGIAGVQLAVVASSIGGAEGSDRPLSGGVSAGRTDEEIQIVFDRYKAALYRLYNRELRKDPTLRGQLVLRLTIEPDGSVSLCQLQSSDMDAPALTDQVVSRVRNFDFGSKEDIVAMTIIYPIDFLPAA
jgi:outer membrane biosynthesis protein TonB